MAAPAPTQAVIVRVRCNLGTFRVTVSESATIGDIKEQLFQQHNISRGEFHLCRDDVVLNEGDTLSSCNIKHGDLLNVNGTVAKVGEGATEATSSSQSQSKRPVGDVVDLSQDANKRPPKQSPGPTASVNTTGGPAYEDVIEINDMDVFIMHEMQESSLCGQHCLNNLVQQSVFNTVDLSEIAQELDAMEREFLTDDATPASPTSGNVDNSGNFSVMVLTTALSRSFGIELVSWNGSEVREHRIEDEKAFVVHNTQAKHWFTIRKIGNHWWNLDSLLEEPVQISPFYLDVYMTQLRVDDNTIFLAKGNVPPAGEYNYSSSDNMNIVWYKEEDLLKRSKNKSAAKYNNSAANTNSSLFDSIGSPTLTNALSGMGSYLSNFLGSSADGSFADFGNNSMGNVNNSNDQGDEDDDLARAIAASLQDR